MLIPYICCDENIKSFYLLKHLSLFVICYFYIWCGGFNRNRLKQIFFSDTSSCSIQVCLTWEARSGNITFRCRVNHLKWKVIIYNPLNKEQGHCLNPLPNSECFPSNNKNTMFQERRTNTTILILKKNKYRNVTGSWTCYHGTNRDKAVVIVPDLKQGTILTYQSCKWNLSENPFDVCLL